MTTLLELQNITIQFGGLMAVDHVNLKVKKGWISALIGPNGAGKSTIFNIITGLYKPSSGNIWFAENDITRYKAYKVTTLGIAHFFRISASLRTYLFSIIPASGAIAVEPACSGQSSVFRA